MSPIAEAGSVWVSVLPSLKGFAAKVKAETGSIGDVTINIDLGNAKETSAKIDEAAHDRTAKIEVDADTAKADAELGATEKEAAKLDGRKVAITVTANTASALASIARVALAADSINKQALSPKINFDGKGIIGDLTSVAATLANVGLSATAASAKFSLLSMAAAGAVKTIGSLGPAVSGAVGAAALLPSIMTAGAATIGTFKIGMSGFGAAVKDAFDPTKAKKFNEELAKLSPNAKAAVLAIKGMQPALDGIKKATQDALFTGMAGTLKTLADQYLPNAKAGFVAIATSINGGAQSFAKWLQMPGTFNMLRGATGNVTTAMDTLIRSALVPAAGAFTTLAAVGTQQLPFVANAIAGVSQAFASMIANAANSGALDAFFKNAVTQLGYIFQILGQLGIVFMNVFAAAESSGGNLLRTLVNITSAMAVWTQSAAGMNLMQSVFEASNAAMAAAKPLLDAIGQALVTYILPALAQVLPAIGAAFGSLAPAVAPFAQIIAALAPVLAVLAGVVAQVLVVALQALAPIVVQLAPLFAAWAVSIGQQLIGAIQALAPLLLSLATFLAQHPQAVLAVVSAIGVLAGGWKVLSAIVSAFFGPLLAIKLAMQIFGVTLSTLLAPFATVGGAIGAFIAKITEAVSKTGLMKLVLQGIGEGLSFVLKSVLGALGPIGALIAIFTVLFTTNAQFRDAIMQLLGAFGQLIGAVVGSLQPAFAAIASVLSGSVGPAFAAIASGLATALVPVIQLIANVITALQPVLVPLIDGFLAIRLAVLGWAAAQAVLDIALSANPIGLLVIAIAALIGGLVAAYQNVGWFRDMVNGVWASLKDSATQFWTGLQQIFSALGNVFSNVVIGAQQMWSGLVTAWNAISTAVSTVWTSVLQPIFSAIGTAFMYLGIAVATILVAPFVIAWNIISAGAAWAWGLMQPGLAAIGAGLTALGNFFTMLWTTYVVPAWNGIVAAIQTAWMFIQTVVFAPIGAAITAVGNFFVMLWTAYVVPAWQGIQAAIMTAWMFIQTMIFAPIGAAITAVGNFFVMLWQTYVVPAWNGIVAAISAAWAAIQANVFAPIGAAVAAVGNFFVGLWHTYVEPAWNGIRDAVGAAWNWVRDNVFAPMGTGVNAIGQAFQSVSDWIGRAWASIKEACRAPVQFVVDVVYNNGIRAVWNSIAGLFGMGQLPAVAMATGGVLPGYAPGRDTVPALLSRGEGILVPEAVRGLGPAFVGWANAHFSGGRSKGGVGTPQGGGYSKGGVAHFADGGILGLASTYGGFLLSALADPVGALKRLFAGVIGAVVPGGGSWSAALQQVPAKAIDSIVAAVSGLLAQLASAFSAAYTAAMNPAPGAPPVVQPGAGFDSGGIAGGTGFLAKNTVSPERVLSPRQTTAFESIVPMLSRMGGNGSTGMTGDFGSLGGGSSGATIVVNPSARMDEADLADAAVHRLNWEMGLIR